MKFSIEKLVHFQCEDDGCKGWFSIRDASFDRDYFCPWCGKIGNEETIMIKDEKTLSRPQFEKWVSSLPYERSVKRFGNHGEWPGNYQDIAVELAWCAWCEAIKIKSA
jgi:hypothetical protein